MVSDSCGITGTDRDQSRTLQSLQCHKGERGRICLSNIDINNSVDTGLGIDIGHGQSRWSITLSDLDDRRQRLISHIRGAKDSQAAKMSFSRVSTPICSRHVRNHGYVLP